MLLSFSWNYLQYFMILNVISIIRKFASGHSNKTSNILKKKIKLFKQMLD